MAQAFDALQQAYAWTYLWNMTYCPSASYPLDPALAAATTVLPTGVAAPGCLDSRRAGTLARGLDFLPCIPFSCWYDSVPTRALLHAPNSFRLMPWAAISPLRSNAASVTIPAGTLAAGNYAFSVTAYKVDTEWFFVGRLKPESTSASPAACSTSCIRTELGLPPQPRLFPDPSAQAPLRLPNVGPPRKATATASYTLLAASGLAGGALYDVQASRCLSDLTCEIRKERCWEQVLFVVCKRNEGSTLVPSFSHNCCTACLSPLRSVISDRACGAGGSLPHIVAAAALLPGLGLQLPLHAASPPPFFRPSNSLA